MLESSSQRISRREANKVFYWIEDSSKTSNNQRLRSAGDNETLFLHRCASRKFHMIDSQNTLDQMTSHRGSKSEWLNWIICIPFIISWSPNESWLHKCDACAKTTWRLGLRLSPAIKNNASHVGRVLAILSYVCSANNDTYNPECKRIPEIPKKNIPCVSGAFFRKKGEISLEDAGVREYIGERASSLFSPSLVTLTRSIKTNGK